MSRILRIDPDRPDQNRLKQVVDYLKNDGVIIYPSDTVYSLGCDVYNKKAYERLCRLKGVKVKGAQFSIVCHDLGHLSQFAQSISTPAFRIIKNALPGPFTFILKANQEIPKIFGYKKKEVGIRIPDHNLSRSIVRELGNPILSASIKNEDDILEYITDPEELEEVYGDKVDLIIDGGPGGNVPSTVIDLSDGDVNVLRYGLGEMNFN